jgi:hypothetical protein
MKTMYRVYKTFMTSVSIFPQILFEFFSDLIGLKTSLVPGRTGQSSPILITLDNYISHLLPTELKNENLKHNLSCRN